MSMTIQKAAVLIESAKKSPGVGNCSSSEEFLRSRPVQELMALNGEDRRAAILAMSAALGDFADRIRKKKSRDAWPGARWVNLHEWRNWLSLIAELVCQPVYMGEEDWCRVFAGLARFEQLHFFDHDYLRRLIRRFEKEYKAAPPTDKGLIAAVQDVAKAIEAAQNAAERRLARQLLAVLRSASELPLSRGEAWTDRAIDEIEGMSSSERSAWVELLVHCAAASGSAPSEKWRAESTRLIKAVTLRRFVQVVTGWLPLVDRPRGVALVPDWRWEGHGEYYISEGHQDVLRSLCWAAGLTKNPDLARALGKLAISAYRKVPGIGPRAVKVGNAAVYALGQMPGMDAVGQLAMLRVKVKFGTAQKLIEKALAAAAEREGLPREEMDELGVPSYGLSAVGRHAEEVQGYTVELVVTGIGSGGVEMRFTRPDGKPQKSIPAAIKASEEIKEMKAAMKDIAAMLPAQRDRIDALFLENKAWAWEVWRERYLDHPLVGVIARRLIWRISGRGGDVWRSAVWIGDEAGGGSLVDVAGAPVRVDEPSAIVRLWHPVEVAADEVLAWRRFFEDRQIRQPFKQAHREVYLLTDAERRTRTYSNRFAAHILRQHQFNALCGVRGWKNKLRLMVDAEYPPATRELRAWADAGGDAGLRAEFWVEGAGDDYGTDTTESGAYLHLVTDQARFYRNGAAENTAHAGGGGYVMRANPALNEPMPLEEVPPLVLSEVMRDVDLFVGVSSVGNNPQWQDGGPDGRHRDYWWSYGFGDLTQTGAGRRDLLGRLLPRLGIAPVCTLEDKFLRVQGRLRAYRIHLGSGNILMEPNDQYLCIVPSGGDELESGRVFLPFEGDRTLAIILSKAFMLAADGQIKDPSITAQIRQAR